MKTIEGYTDDFAYGPAGLIAISEERHSEDDRPAILCYNEDDAPPKVMAVEEAEKMLREISTSIYRGEVGVDLHHTVRTIASKYGITLNP